MPLFSKDVSFDTVQTAVEGLAVVRLRGLDQTVRENIGIYNVHGSFSQSNATEIADAFHDNLDVRVQTIVNSYSGVLVQLGIRKPSAALKTQITSHANEILETQITGMRDTIARFKQETNVKWSSEGDDRAAKAAKMALASKLVLLLEGIPEKSVQSKSTSDSKPSRWSLAREYKVAILIAILGGIGFVGREFVWHDRLAARDRRVTEQQALKNELLPQLDSAVKVAEEFDNQMDLKNDTTEVRRLAMIVSAAVKPLTAKMSTPTRLTDAFGYQAATLYESTVAAALQTSIAATNYFVEERSASKKQQRANSQPDQPFGKAYRRNYVNFQTLADRFEQLIVSEIGK